MNETIMRTFITMTVSGSLLSLLLFALKPLVKHRLPKKVQYYIWFIVIAAFLLPSSRFIILPTTMLPSSQINQVVEQYVSTIEEQEHFDTEQPNEDVHVASTHSIPTSFLLLIWLLGVAFSLGITLFHYFSFIYKIKRSYIKASAKEINMLADISRQRSKPALYRSHLAPTPMLIGIFRAKIVLPNREYTDIQLRNIFMHELIHYSRHDILIKWLSALAKSLHWFNPLAYLMCREINRACELACDEAVIKSFDINDKQSYGNTLIEMVSESHAPRAVMSTTLCEEKKELKERLEAIMKNKGITRRALAFSIIFFIATISFALFLSASAMETKPDVITELIDSIEYVNNEIQFTIPSDCSYTENLNIQIRGRIVYADGFSMSLHFLDSINEEKKWQAGSTYSIAYDEAYQELLMDVSYADQDGAEGESFVDLLQLVSLPIHSPSIQFYHVDMNLLDEVDNWTPLADTTVLAVIFEGEPNKISIYFTPSGTEMYDQRTLLQSINVNQQSSPIYIDLQFEEGILGHLWAVAEYDGVEITSEIYNVYHEN